MNTNKWLVTLPPEGAARQVGQEFLTQFSEKLGSENILVFDCLKYLGAYREMLKKPDEDLAVDLLNQSLTIKSLEFGTTHLLVLALSPVTLFTLNLHKKMGVKNFHWFYEDYRRAEYWKSVLTGYHVFMAVQKGEVENECNNSGVIFKYLPTGTTPHENLMTGAESLRSIDVAFVGIPSPYRISVLESLAAGGIRLKVAGSGWNEYQGPLQDYIISGKWLSSTETRQVLTGAKIGLNLSFDEPGPNREANQISPRIFDIVDSNCLLITEEAPLVEESLKDIKFIKFNSVAAVSEAVKTGLENFKTYQESFARNKEIVREVHSYAGKATEIISLA